MKKIIIPFFTIAVLAAAARAANQAATAAYLDGLDALAANNYADAEKAFTKAIDLDEENPAYYQARGVARTLSEKLDPALKDLQRASRLAPAGGQADWESAAWTAVASKMNNHPEVTFAPASAGKDNRDYAVALSEMAQNYWQSKNNGSYYDKAHKKTVQTRDVFKGDFPSVAAFYTQKHLGLAGGPRNPAAAGDVKTALARIQSKAAAGQNLEALQSLQPLLAANPGDVDLLAAKAQILSNLGDLEDARANYTDLLTRHMTAAAYLGRARIAAQMDDPARAKFDISQAVMLDMFTAGPAQKEILPKLTAKPADPHLLYEKLESQAKASAPDAQLAEPAAALVRAMAATRVRYDERYQDRLAPLEAKLKSHPNDPEAMVAVARFIHDESKVLEERVGPRAEPTRYRIQTPADLQHDLDRADQLVDAAWKNNPNNMAALVAKAHFLNDAADYDAAQEVVNHALSIKKDDPDLLEVLASLVQIQAARHISSAGNLRQPKTFFETNYMESPPVTYKWTIWPSKAELAMAAAHEQQANALMQIAMTQLEKAAASGGATAQGLYYRATLLRVRGQSAEAKDYLTKAVALQPDFQQAWYLLAAICTDLLDTDGAVAARGKAYSLANTTASAQLNTLWYKILHAQLKTARETVAQGVQTDPADPRLPAYLALVNEASEKPDEALAHYRMALAICNANLILHGTRFAPPSDKATLPITPEQADLPAALRIRIAALLLDQNKPAEAAAEYNTVGSALAPFSAVDAKVTPADALFPNPDITPNTIPLPESIATLRIRAAAGLAYANWALAAKDPADTALAAKTYRRLLITYTMTTENLDSHQAIADLGLAELYLHRSQFTEAQTAMQSTPAVPQDLWQEMRHTESAIRSRQK